MELNNNLKHSQLTEKIIKCYFDVYNNLGNGYLESVYENAMLYELQKQGLRVDQQKNIAVYYKDIIVGSFYADLIVNDSVIIELKASNQLNKKHETQLVNYLKATGIEVGLLFNFGRRPEFKRRVKSNLAAIY